MRLARLCGERITALSLVSANVLTLHPADEQPDSLIGCNFSGRALDLQAAMHEWGADLVGIQEARDRHDSQRSGLHFDVFAAARPTDMVGSSFGDTKSWEYLQTGYG